MLQESQGKLAKSLLYLRRSSSFKIKIGGVVACVQSIRSTSELKLKGVHAFFKSLQNPDLVIKTYVQRIPKIRLNEPLFKTKGAWSLYRRGNRVVLKLPSSPPHERIAIFHRDFKEGSLYLNSCGLNSDSLSYPLYYPLDELLWINLLSRHSGFLAHACGINYHNKGLLFIGNSGAGKTTMANLWKDKRNASVLSDDRIILRKINKKFWLYGTPWHGEAQLCSPERVLLHKIFFLKHGKKNASKKISAMEAISRLLSCCFPAFWDRQGMECIMHLCSELTQCVPYCELDFFPDKRILDFIIRER